MKKPFEALTKMHKIPPKLRLKLANECENLQTRVGLIPRIDDLKFYLIYSKDVSERLFNRLMELFKLLMQADYEKSSWGWNEEEKLAEWKHSRTRLIVVTRGVREPKSLIVGEIPGDEEELVGFMCMRFEIGSDKKECALYVYELHVAPQFQRNGIGAELMRMARLIGVEFKMDKLMLTVFRSNKQALQFYKKLNFTRDKSCPDENEADYAILHLKLPEKRRE